ncbi:MAG: aldehyde dehydrogenase family protein [Pseudomonadales bacterium]|nr:aldehyde dehydrogenase family protein [Pseudomonadota bacterium]MED5444072.1 aldehyde dehydrogenase family protein [Pseudomonadota bacterium]
MDNAKKFYINGEWVDPIGTETMDVINPATEEPICAIALGNSADVDRAVAAAKAAFETFSQTTREERIALLEKIIECYKARMGDIAAAVSQEMGAPVGLANAAQAPAGLGHLMYTLNALKEFSFEQMVAGNKIVREPIGVCGLITPWNWPLNQIAAKVGPAIAAGCTMVLKPTEIAPINALIFAEVMHEAGVPAGVFNLVNGTGPDVGVAMSSHPDIDMMSFTGSTRAGISVAQEAAKTVKRVTQELGGKSPNIILDDADFAAAVSRDMAGMCMNTGQSCNAPTRMLVPETRMDEAAAIAKATAEAIVVGDPSDAGTQVGPLVSQMQFDKVQALIQKGIDEGAKVETGGVGRPEGMNRGYFVKPTVFSHVTNDMTIAQEEIFGPVLSLIGYKDEEDAVRIANDTVYGLSAYISGSTERAKAVASKLRAGNVHLNGAGVNPGAPFGGYKQSGNGREFSVWGLEEFLETKAVIGFDAA